MSQLQVHLNGVLHRKLQRTCTIFTAAPANRPSPIIPCRFVFFSSSFAQPELTVACMGHLLPSSKWAARISISVTLVLTFPGQSYHKTKRPTVLLMFAAKVVSVCFCSRIWIATTLFAPVLRVPGCADSHEGRKTVKNCSSLAKLWLWMRSLISFHLVCRLRKKNYVEMVPCTLHNRREWVVLELKAILS